MLNADEILRIPYNKLLVNIRGNKPLLLDKMIYTEHELANKLIDVSVGSYKPNWNTKKEIIKKSVEVVEKKEIKKEKVDKECEEVTFETF